LKQTHPGEETQKVKVSWTIIDKSIHDRIGILTTDALQDSRFGDSESVHKEKFRSVLTVPIFFHDTLWGVFFLNTSLERGIFTPDDLKFVTGIANETAVFIEYYNLLKSQITREKMAEVGELVAGLSHYIKNLMFGFTASQGVVEKAIKGRDLDLIESLWPIIKSTSDQISDLVNDMLYFSKERKQKRVEIQFHDIINDIVSLYRPIFLERKIDVELHLADDLPLCSIDQQSFYRVFLNLIKNAIDAVKDLGGGEITIETSATSDEVMCSIIDSGNGIPSQNIGKIFHYLFSTKGYEGTGIGLFVTKQIVEDHGGKISVSSELGQGTTFTIRVPIAQPDSSSENENQN